MKDAITGTMLLLQSLTLLLTMAALAEAAPQKTIAPAEADAHLTQRVEPTVPALAKAARIGGKVKLHIVISPSGDVSSVEVISGHPVLVQSAVETVKKWKYKPFAENDAPVAVATDVEIEFPGGGPNVSFSTTSLTFGTEAVDMTSQPLPIMLTNSGTATLNIASIAASANFGETNTCYPTLAPGANCTINVTFTPTASGTLDGTLSVTDNAPGSPQMVSLSGTGSSTGPSCAAKGQRLRRPLAQFGLASISFRKSRLIPAVWPTSTPPLLPRIGMLGSQ